MCLFNYGLTLNGIPTCCFLIQSANSGLSHSYTARAAGLCYANPSNPTRKKPIAIVILAVYATSLNACLHPSARMHSGVGFSVLITQSDLRGPLRQRRSQRVGRNTPNGLQAIRVTLPNGLIHLRDTKTVFGRPIADRIRRPGGRYQLELEAHVHETRCKFSGECSRQKISRPIRPDRVSEFRASGGLD